MRSLNAIAELLSELLQLSIIDRVQVKNKSSIVLVIAVIEKLQIYTRKVM